MRRVVLVLLAGCTFAVAQEQPAPSPQVPATPVPTAPVAAPPVTRCIALGVPELGTVVRPNVEKNLDRATVLPPGWYPVGGGASDSGTFVVACSDTPAG
jgi:hypothetical protein